MRNPAASHDEAGSYPKLKERLKSKKELFRKVHCL